MSACQRVGRYIEPATPEEGRVWLLDGAKRRHKYNARRTEYKGEVYDSKAEADRAAVHDLRVLAGVEWHWRRGNVWTLVDASPGHRAVTYRPDFEVTPISGPFFLEDVKGVETAIFRLKMRLFRERYPKLPLLIVTKQGERWLP